MDYATFLRRFGGSLRTKNLDRPHERTGKKAGAKQRAHVESLPSELPAEFIRQDPWEAEYLFLMARRARHGILETGRFNGGSLFLMACANGTVPIYSIDIAPRNDAFLRDALSKSGIATPVHLIVGDSQRSRYDVIGRYDLLFVDGDHSYDGCTADLENWYPGLEEGGHVILHDSYHGSPVMDACADFLDRHDPIVHISPFRQRNHTMHPHGSLAHVQKRRAAGGS